MDSQIRLIIYVSFVSLYSFYKQIWLLHFHLLPLIYARVFPPSHSHLPHWVWLALKTMKSLNLR